MAEFPAFPVWTDAYLGDTTHLTTIEHGTYLLLLMAMWRSGDCSLPNDDKLLARYARLTPGQWAKIRPTIMAFFKQKDGKISQGRLTDEWQAVRQRSKRQSEKAKSRWLKDKDSTNATAEPQQCPTDASLNPSHIHNQIEAKASIPRARKPRRSIKDLDPEFSRVWAAYPKRDGCGEAEKLWLQARKEIEFEALAEPLRAYIRAVKGTDPQFIKKLSTWLRDKCWLDEQSHAANRPRTSTEDLDNLANISSTEDLARLFSAPNLRVVSQ